MTVEDVVRDRLKQQHVQDKPGVELTDDTNLIDENVLDSLGIFSLRSFLEERFRIHIDEDDITIDNFETVPAIARLVESKQSTS